MSSRQGPDFILSGYHPGDGLGDGFWIVGRDRILHWVGEFEVERVHQPTKRRSCPHCGTDIGPRAAACDSRRIKQRRAAA